MCMATRSSRDVTGTPESQWASITLRHYCQEYVSKQEHGRDTQTTASAVQKYRTFRRGSCNKREIMAVSGHKSKTSLQSYWQPKLGDQRKWSNILASPNSSPPDKKCKPTAAGQFSSGCTIHCNVQININKLPWNRTVF